jgi:serine protease Do
MMSPISQRATVSAFRRVRAAALATSVGAGLVLAPMAFLWQDGAAMAAQTASPSVQLPSFAPLVKKVLLAVVNISVTSRANAPEGDDQDMDSEQGPGPGTPSSPFDEFLRKFYEQQGQGSPGTPRRSPGAQRVALGSGFIIDPAGYVVTNNHVVANADKVSVVFQDGSKHPAKLIGRDTKTDLALLKIDAKEPLPFVSWGDSNALQVGDWVLAVGNPFGLGGTVSSGIISARGRDIHSGPYDDYLQLDAAINRGNSGGPTFSLDGQVIGINTAIYSPNGGSVGIGFAIPASLAQPVIEQLRSHGKVERGWLGVQIQDVTPEIAQGLGLPRDGGALVADVTKDSPAAKIGVKQGDVILSYDGHAINKMRDLPIVVAETPVGQAAELKLWRDGKDITLQPMIAIMPDNLKMASNNEEQHAQSPATSAMGLKLAPLTQELRRQLNVPRAVKGVVVTGVAESSPLAALGIAPGDVIQAINQEPVATPKEVASKLEATKQGGDKNLLFLINRHGVNQYVALSVGGGNDKG